MAKLTHRGVHLVVPDGDAIDRMLDRIDSGGLSQRLLKSLSGSGAEGLRRLFGLIYQVGLTDGVDRALELGGAQPPDALNAAASVEAVEVRSPVQAVVERYRSSEVKLPHPPDMAIQLNRMLGDPEYDISTVVDLIRREPTLTARVMSLGASPVFAGGGRSPRSLSEAVLRIGSRELTKYLLALCNRRLFAFKAERSAGALRDLWQHSLATALMSEELASEVDGAHPASFFLHGLLHDIGRALLIQIFDELLDEPHYADAFSEEQIERTIDALHGQFGMALLQKWRFGESFSEVALFHHQPKKSFAHLTLVSVVSLADAMVCRLGIGAERQHFAGEEMAEHPSAQFLGLGRDVLEFATKQMRRSMEAMADEF